MRLLAALLGPLLIGACGLAPSAPASPPGPTATPAPTATAVPTATPMPTPSPTPAPPAATPTAAESTDFEQSPPPVGSLSATKGVPVEGRLGSWCYHAGCLDGLPPPKAVLPLVELSAADDQLAFTMPETLPFVAWSATYADQSLAEDEISLGRGGPDDPSEPPPGTPTLTEVVFDAPPAGDWVVNVGVWFGGGIGDAHYYWHVTVP